MQARFRIFQALTWAQVFILVPMAALGTVYFAALLADYHELSSSIFPIASFLADLIQILFYGFIGFAIVLGISRRMTRPTTPLEQGLFEKLASVLAQTKSRMGFVNQTRPFIRRGSSNAFYRGKGRIVVGEKLVLRTNDRELAGIVGHELAHALKHHVLYKTIMIPALLFSIIIALLLVSSFEAGGILLWTLASLFTLVQIPFSWRLEYSADAKAAELLGGDIMSEALQKLGSMNFGGISFTHPPLSSRIRKISAYGPVPFTLVPVTAPVTPPPVTAPPLTASVIAARMTAPATSNAPQLQEKGRADDRETTQGNARPLETYGENLLSQGETTLWRGRQAYHLRYPILALVFFAGISFFGLGPPGETIGTLSTLLWMVFTIVTIISLILDRKSNFCITSQRIIAGEAAMPTQDLINVSVQESSLERLRKVGKVYFVSQGGSRITFRRVSKPEQVRQVALYLMATRRQTR